MVTVTDFIFLSSKIIADHDCSHKIKRLLLLGRKAVTNVDSLLQSRDITLSTNIHLVKDMVFPVVMYGCELDYKESWGLKNWCFWSVVLEKTLESPLDCKEIQLVHPKGNQSWIFTGRTDVEAETPVLWPPDVTHLKRPWCWGRLKAGGEGGDRGWHGWMALPTRWTWVWTRSRSWWWTGKPGVLQSMGSQRVRHDWATELNWVSQIVFPQNQYPLETQNVALFENRDFVDAMNEVEREAESNYWCPCKKRKEHIEKHMGRKPCEGERRDWSDVGTSQKLLGGNQK